MPTYNPKIVEPRWQRFWLENKTFKTPDLSEKPKFYILDMFPYPSGAGLHVGHPEGYTATDILARYQRMRGFNVLHPMGWDAFGLPAEQYAIETGTHPRETTQKNIATFRRQIQMLGFSYDWDREVDTTDPTARTGAGDGGAAADEEGAAAEELAVAFARVLRGGGLSVPIGNVLTFGEGLAAVGLGDRDAAYWTARTTLVRRPEDLPFFDRAFAVFWELRQPGGEPPPEEVLHLTLALDAEDGDDEQDAAEFMRTLRTDLFDDEVYVFTPKGEVKTLPAGATPIDFAYAVHTDVGHRTVGAKVNGRIVPLHYRLHSGDFVEILTSKKGRGPSRDWMALAASSRARNKIRQWFSRETREDAEQKGRESLEQALKAQNLPYRKLAGSAVLAQVIREAGFKKAEDFYIALGSGKLQTGQIVRKVLTRLKTAEVAEEEAVPLKPKTQTIPSTDLGITVSGLDDVLVTAGGIIPDADIATLKEAGIAEIFGPGTSIGQIARYFRENVRRS